MSNRESLRARMPSMLLHEGVWEGTYRLVDMDGSVIDTHSSRVICEFPDEGPYVYVQRNFFTWLDGGTVSYEFGGELRGDRIWWDNERFRGYSWVSENDIVMLTLDRKDQPGVSFTEVILIAPDRNHRARTWHWFKDGQLTQRTLCDERKVE